MKDFEYYGLFLTDEGMTKLLLEWLAINCPDVMGKNWFYTTMYLDHCTLLHKSQKDYYTEREILESNLGKMCAITIDAVGYTDKAMAFRVNKELLGVPCANNTPHITICTFKDGKPVDSNSITEWKDIEPIIVETKLEKR